MLTNEQIAEWAGFTELELRPTYLIISDGVWFAKYPDDGIKHAIPDFPNDMNACEKYLVPKLIKEYGVVDIRFSYFGDKVSCEFYQAFYQWLQAGQGSTMSLAFCAALSKLVEGKE